MKGQDQETQKGVDSHHSDHWLLQLSACCLLDVYSKVLEYSVHYSLCLSSRIVVSFRQTFLLRVLSRNLFTTRTVKRCTSNEFDPHGSQNVWEFFPQIEILRHVLGLSQVPIWSTPNTYCALVRKSVNHFRCDTHVHCIGAQILRIGMAACLFTRLICSIHDTIHIIPPVSIGSIIPGAPLISILLGYDVCVYFVLGVYFKCGSSNSWVPSTESDAVVGRLN